MTLFISIIHILPFYQITRPHPAPTENPRKNDANVCSTNGNTTFLSFRSIYPHNMETSNQANPLPTKIDQKKNAMEKSIALSN